MDWYPRRGGPCGDVQPRDPLNSQPPKTHTSRSLELSNDAAHTGDLIFGWRKDFVKGGYGASE